MSKETIYYMTHAGRSSESLLLLKHWGRFDIPIVVFTPKNSGIPQTKNMHVEWGDCGPMGEPMYTRIIHALEMMVDSQDDHALFVEFDCMCLLPHITWRNGLHGSIQLRYYEHALQFMAERYVTPPYMLDRNSAIKMLAVAKEYPEVQEGGYADRLLSALANLAGVPIQDFPERSWSKLTVDPERLTPPMKLSLDIAASQGVKWYHFIKTKEQFDFVLSLNKNTK